MPVVLLYPNGMYEVVQSEVPTIKEIQLVSQLRKQNTMLCSILEFEVAEIVSTDEDESK